MIKRFYRRAVGSVLAVCLALCGVVALGVSPSALGERAQAQTPDVIRAIRVEGNQRIESSTILSYMTIGPGSLFDPASIDTSLKVLFATGLFADVAFDREGSVLIVRVAENPIINRVIFEGNRSLGDDKINEEIQAQPRAIFTRARVQSDVQRIIALYRRSGRFAAQVEPQVVQQPQNRVDLIFEISEGPVTGVRRINFIGNEAFNDRRLRSELITAESRWWRFFSANDNYDPDRLEVDRQFLRDFYTDKGYADFSVTSAVAELTPDQEDFFITFVVDEGELYRFGEVTVRTELDTLNEDGLRALVPIQEGAVFQQSRIEDAVDSLTFAAGAAGYAFVDVRPSLERDRDTQTINLEFSISEGPRVYIERIDIIGNTRTLDSVIRREMQILEGDAFNRVLMNRSQSRIRGLGFFGEVEVTELPAARGDRAIVQVKVEEQPTGELSFGAGFSSVDAFLIDLSITERNLRGRGQFLRFRVSTSSTRQIVDIRFTEPRFLGRNIAAGFDLFNTRQDFASEASFLTNSTGGSLRLGFPVTENASLGLRYTVRADSVTTFAGASEPIVQQQGDRFTSVVGYTLRWDRRNDPFQPTRGFDASISQDVAGVGGDVRYLRTGLDGGLYRGLLPGFIASFQGSAGYISEWGGDEVRINDRFFKGGGSFRGFETAGLGPRVIQTDPDTGEVTASGDALGGQFFAIGTTELTFPLGLPEEYGIRGSLFSDFGYLGVLDDSLTVSTTNSEIADDLTLRASAGVSIFWRSPFGPIRFDFSQVLAEEDYDRTETFRFSTSTTF